LKISLSLSSRFARRTLGFAAGLLLAGSVLTFAGEDSLVTAVSPSADGGTITIAGVDAPFVVGANTTILVDGKTATISDVQVGMQVVSRSLPDSVDSEIDLKTVAAAPEPKKKGKKKKAATSSDDESQ
jgi:hypothetical protein